MKTVSDVQMTTMFMLVGLLYGVLCVSKCTGHLKIVRIVNITHVTLKWEVKSYPTEMARFRFVDKRNQTFTLATYDGSCILEKETTRIRTRDCGYDVSSSVLWIQLKEADERYLQGVFGCVALSKQLDNIQLYFYKPPTKPVITVAKGTTLNGKVWLKLRCSSTSRSVPAEYRVPVYVTWSRKPGTIIADGTDRHVISGDFQETLTINPAVPSDCDGVIVCTATEPGSTLNSSSEHECHIPELTTTSPSDAAHVPQAAPTFSLSAKHERDTDSPPTADNHIIGVVAPVVGVVVVAIVIANAVFCVCWKRRKVPEAPGKQTSGRTSLASARPRSDAYEVAPEVEMLSRKSVKFNPRKKYDVFPPLPEKPELNDEKENDMNEDIETISISNDNKVHQDDVTETPVCEKKDRNDETKTVEDDKTDNEKVKIEQLNQPKSHTYQNYKAPKPKELPDIESQYFSTSGLKVAADEVRCEYLTALDIRASKELHNQISNKGEDNSNKM